MRNLLIEGHVSASFKTVRDAFAENFSRRHELGGTCCVYYRGEKVVDPRICRRWPSKIANVLGRSINYR